MTVMSVSERDKSVMPVMTRCKVCNHPRRDEFDTALAGGTMTQAQVARAVGCSPMSVQRHCKNHLLPVVARQVRDDLELASVDILGELRTLYHNMKANLARVDGTDNWPAIRAFNAETRRNLELLAKLLLVLGSQSETDYLQSEEWHTLRAVLVAALAPYPAARAEVVRALSEHGT